MAAFGEHNYATPFGAISASGFFNPQGSGFYDYSGFSSREGFFGFSGNIGWTGFSSFCGEEGLEFIPFKPTLSFPLNFAILDGTVEILWKEAVPADPCDEDIFYEVQYTRTFLLDSGWRTIATDIPKGTASLEWDVSNIPYTDDGGIRIRARDKKFIYSDWSKTNEPFIIANHAPNPVVLLGPLPNDVFDYCIPVLWKEPKIRDIDGHEIVYQIEMTDRYSSNSGWIVIPDADEIPSGTSSYNVAAFDFPDGDDYGVRISAIDELGLGSATVKTGPIKIKHQGSFIIDTLPPEGSISINDGATLAANSKVKLTLFAFDETTGIKDVSFRNAEEDENCWSDYDTFTNEKFWDLPKSDGVKRVYVRYRDYAGNISEVCDCEIVSRVLCGAGNVTDIEVFNNKLYVAFDSNGNLIEYKILVKQAASLPEPELSALARYNNNLYIATFDESSGASIYSFDGKAKLRFGIAGVKVLTMQAFNSILFLGLDDGRVVSYDEDVMMTVHSASSAITRLRTDGSVLYATLQGGGEFLRTANGITWASNAL